MQISTHKRCYRLKVLSSNNLQLPSWFCWHIHTCLESASNSNPTSWPFGNSGTHTLSTAHCNAAKVYMALQLNARQHPHSATLYSLQTTALPAFCMMTHSSWHCPHASRRTNISWQPSRLVLCDLRKLTSRQSVIHSNFFEFFLPGHKADWFFEENMILIHENALGCNLMKFFKQYLPLRDCLSPLSSHLWIWHNGLVPTWSFFMA